MPIYCWVSEITRWMYGISFLFHRIWGGLGLRGIISNFVNKKASTIDQAIKFIQLFRGKKSECMVRRFSLIPPNGTQLATLVHIIISCYLCLSCEINGMTFQFSDAISENWLFVLLGVDRCSRCCWLLILHTGR